MTRRSEASLKRKRIKDSAASRGIEFSLTLSEVEFLLVRKHCAYCNVLMTKKSNTNNCLSFDRIDSSKGYHFGNVIACCRKCNSDKEPIEEQFREVLKEFLESVQKSSVHELCTEQREQIMTMMLRQQQEEVYKMTDNVKRDLVLAPGTYAYMQDVTKGVIKTYTGPTVINPTAQEIPVVYDHNNGKFVRAASLEDALRVAPVAPEGFYITLRNPAKDNLHPSEGSAQNSAELQTGRTINVPGPATFGLWPSQVAQVVQGHHLHSNQYLLVRVYNEEEARKNWTTAVAKSADGATSTVTKKVPSDLTVGKQLIIQGTEVSFYIPPTGIEVVMDESGNYVRDALTLERLEYAILVDENGKKRYEKGPQVVFPLPSERFIESRDGDTKGLRKFRAIELNEIQGLHIKVIADYEENGVSHKIGEELFLTGRDTQIYFPREEHSAIKYDGKAKHFATAIPVGEARYVMNRISGEIKMVKGPAMLLPDPRTEVIVRRVLSDRQCGMWYPGNTEALIYNQQLRNILANVPTTRQGAISEGDFERNSRNASQQVRKSASAGGPSAALYNSVTNVGMMESSRVSGDQALVSDEFTRGSSYSQPRSITLDTKFQGVPSIDIWTGYAALVVSKTGKRRVEMGPTTLLMEYDETLEILELSTGKPKTTDHLLKTPFLQVLNNKVSDIVEVETSDHVKVQIYLSNHVNFTGEPEKWFQIDNYVKFLCDHVRSLLKGYVQKLRVEDFYANSTDLVRDFILGKIDKKDGKRTGLLFEQNGMQVTDVEVLRVQLMDDKIRALLDQAQHEVVRSNLELSNLKRNLDVFEQKEEILRTEAQTKFDTQLNAYRLQQDLMRSEAEKTLLAITNQMTETVERLKVQSTVEAGNSERFTMELKRLEEKKALEEKFEKEAQERKIALLEAETESVKERFSVVQSGFSEALLALSNNDTMVKVAQAFDTSKIIAGESLSNILDRLFTGTALNPLVQKIAHRGNGESKVVGPKGVLPG